MDENVKIIKKTGLKGSDANRVSISVDKLDEIDSQVQIPTDEFKKFADPILEEIEKSIASLEGNEIDFDTNFLMKIKDPIMQLKSSSQMFGFDLVGILAGIMFAFLETIDDLDKEALAIVSAHHTTLVAIVGNSLSGDGGQYGSELKKELDTVCKRYLKSRKKK